MKATIEELFEELFEIPAGDGIIALAKAVSNKVNTEQLEAGFERFAKISLYVLKRNSFYQVEAVNTFPRFETDMIGNIPFFLGGMEIWSEVFKEQYKYFLADEVDLELIKQLP